MGISGIAGFVTQVLGPFLSDKIGRKPVLFVMFGLGMLGGILFATAAPNTAPGLIAFI